VTLRMRIAKVAMLTAAAAGTGCGDEGGSGGGAGSLRIQLSAEETITEGLTPGADEENTKDHGVTYDKFLVAIGRVKLARSATKESREEPSVYIADMRTVGAQGTDLGVLAGLSSGQWDQLGYETPVAPADAKVLPGVSAADAQVMIDQKLTYWIEGTVNRTGKPVRFRFQVATPTVLSDCESDGEPGLAITEGGQSSARLTLHGDHLWFDSLPTGSEGTVARRADWLAVAADLLGKTEVTADDLAQVRAEQVFPSRLPDGSPGYNLSGASIATARDWVVAQLATQGHLNGEGECVWTAQR